MIPGLRESIQGMPAPLRQEVLNRAFWLAVDIANQGSRDVAEERIVGIVDSFIDMGFTTAEIRVAVQKRVKL